MLFRVLLTIVLTATVASAQSAQEVRRQVGNAVLALHVISQQVSPDGTVVVMLRSGQTLTLNASDIDPDLSHRATNTAAWANAPAGPPANQGDPRFHTRPTNPNLNPESSAYVSGSAPNYPPAPSPTGATAGGGSIRERCASEWPRDFRMQQYCIDKQGASLSVLGQRSMTTTNEQMIRSECVRQWGDDYRMRDYCETKQLEALRQLGSR